MSRDREAYNAYQREYQLKRYHARRAEAISTLGGKCASCGYTEMLEIDHIDPATKSFPISKLWSISKACFYSELKKCQLLCKYCHARKSHRRNAIPITIDGLQFDSIHEACRLLKIGYERAIKIGEF